MSALKWGRRLLSELAMSRTIETDKTVNEDGKLNNVKADEPRPFNGVEVPDIESAYASLQSHCLPNLDGRDKRK